MKNSFKILLCGLSLLLSLAACKKEQKEEAPKVVPESDISKPYISGFAQKGPFTVGSSVTIYDLNSNYIPTGKSYNTIITDNSGLFEMSSVSLSSGVVKLLASGYFYNENLGRLSASPIILSTITDLRSDSMANINLLTYLEMPRVEYLIQSGLSFDSAKSQAQNEVLAIFSINNSGLPVSENLTIAQSDTGNAILLAISCLIQGFRTEAELTELIANIANDIRTDGVLSNASYGSALINHAPFIDTIYVRNQLENRYAQLGVSATIPYFEYYFKQFIQNTSYVADDEIISYPANGLFGQNVLYKPKLNLNRNTEYSLCANLKSYATVKIEIKRLSGDMLWFYTASNNINWSVSTFYSSTLSQTYTSIIPGNNTDLVIQFGNGSTTSTFRISYYEMNRNTPVFTKVITVQ